MKVLIAGSGKMGTDIFQYLLPFGHDIMWLCLNEEEAEGARKHFLKKADRQLRNGILEQAAYDAMMRRVSITSDLSVAVNVDIVIESIWEQASEKKALFRKLDQYLPDHAILTSNTSSVPIQAIIPSEKRNTRFCGLHFFFPAALKNLVEINAPEQMDPAVLDMVKAFMERIGRNCIILPEPAHFVMNRLLLGVQNEAVKILQEYPVPVKEVDTLVRVHLFPIGIFEFFDHVGNDVMLASVTNYVHHQADGGDYAPLLESLQKKVQENLLGLKTGAGYYKHPVDTDGFKCSLPENVQQVWVKRLESAWYQSVQDFLARNILTAQALDDALMEYWGESVSFIEKGRQKGYFV